MTATDRPRTLVITPTPTVFGGVATKAARLVGTLQKFGREVTVASFASLRDPATGFVNARFPGAVFGATPKTSSLSPWIGAERIAVGCRFPEFEPNYYRRSKLWQRLIAEYDEVAVVSGNILPAHVLNGLSVPHVIWFASDVMGDRKDRQAAMPPLRRGFDRTLIAPRLVAMERSVLQGNSRLLGVSRYSLKSLADLHPNQEPNGTVLPIPIDTDVYRPEFKPEAGPDTVTLGLAGRHDDPRKNSRLAIEALAVLRRRGLAPRMHVAGPGTSDIEHLATQVGVADQVTFLGRLDDDALPAFFGSLNAFLIPSHQEGLAITGLEAMASGVPVISTACGGPEDYVHSGTTGLITETTAESLADAIEQIIEDPERRRAMGTQARSLMEREFSVPTFETRLAEHWSETYSTPLVTH